MDDSLCRFLGKKLLYPTNVPEVEIVGFAYGSYLVNHVYVFNIGTLVNRLTTSWELMICSCSIFIPLMSLLKEAVFLTEYPAFPTRGFKRSAKDLDRLQPTDPV